MKTKEANDVEAKSVARPADPLELLLPLPDPGPLPIPDAATRYKHQARLRVLLKEVLHEVRILHTDEERDEWVLKWWVPKEPDDPSFMTSRDYELAVRRLINELGVTL